MKINEKLRQLREENHWSQEEMAERMNMSPSGYAKIERGETKLNLDKLQNIAQIFNIDIIELMNNDGKSVVFHMNGNNGCSDSVANYYQSTNNEVLVKEIEHLNTLLKEKDKQIQMLEEIVQLLKQE